MTARPMSEGAKGRESGRRRSHRHPGREVGRHGRQCGRATPRFGAIVMTGYADRAVPAVPPARDRNAPLPPICRPLSNRAPAVRNAPHVGGARPRPRNIGVTARKPPRRKRGTRDRRLRRISDAEAWVLRKAFHELRVSRRPRKSGRSDLESNGISS